MTFEPEASPEDFANVWQSWLPLMREGEEVIFVARRREDRQFVGVGGAHNLRSHTPELGIWVKEGLHGQGYGREIVQGIARWASERFQPPHFLYPVAEQNTASRRLVESLGGVLAAAANASSMTRWCTTCRLNADRPGLLFLSAAITAATACGFVLMIEACRVKQLRNSNMIILLPAPPPVSARRSHAVLSVKAIG